MNPLARLIAAIAIFACLSAGAQEGDSKAAVQKFVDSLHFKSGTVAIDAAHATLNLTSEFRFLDAHDAQRVLHDLWGNPPDSDVLGMLSPAGASLTDEKNSWVVVISYSSDGYVSDSEASTLDYDKLLKEMQQSAHESNAERTKQGYPSIEIVGWATPPHYDAASNKIYWAKELDFGGAHEHTLNYDIRVLGRDGYLSFNAVAGMHQLAMVKERMPQVLEMTEFDAGQRYADFSGIL